MISDLSFFPLPYFLNHELFDGSVVLVPKRCSECNPKICDLTATEEISLCSYGFIYQRIAKDIVVCGVVLRERLVFSPARKKNLGELKEWTISGEQYDMAISSLEKTILAAQIAIEEEKRRVIQKYVNDEAYKLEFLASLKHKIIEGLSFVHDYKQINTQIAQNINVIIESKYEGTDFEQKIEKATLEEKAIYMASKLLEEKLNVAKILVNPHMMNKESDFKKFRFHGLLIKYRRIYTSYIEKNKIDFQLNGQSYQDIVAHPTAVAVIPHTFIDNAIKYSPREGIIHVEIHDSHNSIYFSVSSYGPRILPDEMDKIFQPFYRGQVARKQEEEGAGYGLYVGQLVAKEHLGTEIKVEQEKVQKPQFGHWTTFSIEIPLKAKILVQPFLM
jgi:signal transduction histidine kinase